EPQRRYPTAEALADDLRRSLDGEPIHARPIGKIGRLLLWCRRRSAVAALLSLLMLVLAGGVGAGVAHWLRGEARRAEAERERDRARDTLVDTRSAADQLFTQVSDERLLRQPGLHSLRKQLLETARDYYLKFVREQGDDPSLRSELAWAYQRLGTITAEIGSRKEAAEYLERSRELFQQLSAEQPAEARHRLRPATGTQPAG